MANLNKTMLIGRLTRDPEVRTFSNGGKVVNIGFAVNNRKKDGASGDWVDDPMFIDLKLFSRGDNTKQVDLVEQSLHKGSQLFVEGHLVLEQWNDQSGQKRSKHVIYVDNFQFLDPRDGSSGGRSYSSSSRSSYDSGSRSDNDSHSDFDDADGPPDENIPF